ncbi:AAA family ATPase [Panacibacter ginsenosidivorans]|uniref:AAA family ATPase n=1 Tax=Panacibacter ginsenosidivorans TaxID=1813871 RepID=A0A5B8V788_9BACT|nr:AAA family ATPase [Panacibacter ginsenosidivorans]QEC66641.1 AAA family ATPase [Panacibacter ginsenosidivorans]
MIDFAAFIKLLFKRKFILIGIPLTAVIITYFLVRNMPDVYVSKARIATGIVDNSANLLDKNTKQESEINLEFNNLIQQMQLKRMIDQVSYRLIMHDLTDNEPFRSESKLLKQLNGDAKKHAIAVYTEKYKTKTELSLYNPDQNGLNEVIKSMSYDELSLKTKLSLYRVSNSDYIDIQFESENPKLSAFIVNTLTKEFIEYNDSLLQNGQDNTVNFLEKLLKEKYAAMNNKIAELKAYKIQNHVLNLNEMAKSLYGQIADFETRKQTAEKEIVSYGAALENIDNKFKPEDRKYLESTLTNINSEIIADKDQLRKLNESYVSSNFDPAIKSSIDSVRAHMTSKINQSSDKYIFNPLSAKQDLVTEKLSMEVSRDLAKNSVASLDNELVRLNQKFDKLVPHEAVIQAYENDIDVASREYLEILQKYNQTSLETNFSVRLKQIEAGMPGSAQPSKKMLLVILSGIISFVFCVVAMFVLFYLDDAIREPKDLANKTKKPVLGYLNLLSGSMLDLKQVWQTQSADENLVRFKDLLRSVRFELQKEMGTEKILAITSMKEGEGKTFFSISLAYACAMANKKVLLIDGNFNNNAISQTVKPDHFLEDIFNPAHTSDTQFASQGTINVVANRGNDISLLEVADEVNIKQKLMQIKQQFDLVIIETSSLNTLNKAKEWMMFADKTIAIFAAGQNIDETKQQHINYLSGLNNKFIGWILNKVSTGKGRRKK